MNDDDAMRVGPVCNAVDSIAPLELTNWQNLQAQGRDHFYLLKLAFCCQRFRIGEPRIHVTHDLDV
jgi:hypothetical protein